MGTAWYLWAVNDHPMTNGYLAKVIGEQNPEYECRDKICADGIRRNLYRCPMGYTNVQKALAAIPALKLKVEVFREDDRDVVMRYDLWKQQARKRARRSRALHNMRSRLGLH